MKTAKMTLAAMTVTLLAGTVAWAGSVHNAGQMGQISKSGGLFRVADPSHPVLFVANRAGTLRLSFRSIGARLRWRLIDPSGRMLAGGLAGKGSKGTELRIIKVGTYQLRVQKTDPRLATGLAGEISAQPLLLQVRIVFKAAVRRHAGKVVPEAKKTPISLSRAGAMKQTGAERARQQMGTDPAR